MLVYKLLCGYILNISWVSYSGVELLGHMVSTFNQLRNCQTFIKVVAFFCTLTSNVVGLVLPDFSVLTLGDILC